MVVPWELAVVPWELAGGGLLGALPVADDPLAVVVPWGLAVVPWELPRPRSQALLVLLAEHLPRPNRFRGATNLTTDQFATNLPSPSN